MTKRERMLAVLHGELPDCVPCSPDISNMVPCRLTGRPFWHVYLYQDPPLWKAYLDAARYFDIDAGFELYTVDVQFDLPAPSPWEQRLVGHYSDGGPITQLYRADTGEWASWVTVYPAYDPPTSGLDPAKVGLPAVPTDSEPIVGVKPQPSGLELWETVRAEMGDDGICGLWSGCRTCFLGNPDDVYGYHDNPEPYRARARQMAEDAERRVLRLAAMEHPPDFLFCGGSGTLIWQTPAIFRELVLPVLQRTCEVAASVGLPTHVHSCGPETELVKMAARETKLTIIDPLELPPMGDCDLGELKRLYGDQIVLKGNLHTSRTMLFGSVDDVVTASRLAIDQAADGGGFVLSTGDQCGRDTPEENLRAAVEVARTYGAYPRML